nr:MAG TPA: hypothetical protein [Caudoviricetes sp.]
MLPEEHWWVYPQRIPTSPLTSRAVRKPLMSAVRLI